MLIAAGGSPGRQLAGQSGTYAISDPIIGRRLFTDGIERDGYQDAVGLEACSSTEFG
jgi:hypothetical protein